MSNEKTITYYTENDKKGQIWDILVATVADKGTFADENHRHQEKWKSRQLDYLKQDIFKEGSWQH